MATRYITTLLVLLAVFLPTLAQIGPYNCFAGEYFDYG